MERGSPAAVFDYSGFIRSQLQAGEQIVSTWQGYRTAAPDEKYFYGIPSKLVLTNSRCMVVGPSLQKGRLSTKFVTPLRSWADDLRMVSLVETKFYLGGTQVP